MIYLCFGTCPKRHYQYIPFIVYPDKPYDELTDEFKQKLVHRYCLDPTGAIVKTNDKRLFRMLIVTHKI